MIESLCLICAKFSMLDSYFSHAMVLCTIQGSPKVHFFLSNFLFLKILMRETFFNMMVKLTNSLVEPRT
jgi:hypothetical protein